MSRLADMAWWMRRDDVLMVKARDKAQRKEMNGAYRVPGANKVLNTDLQTRRVFQLVFFLGSRHVEYPKSLVIKPISR